MKQSDHTTHARGCQGVVGSVGVGGARLIGLGPSVCSKRADRAIWHGKVVDMKEKSFSDPGVK